MQTLPVPCFADRAEAGRMLAVAFAGVPLERPLVLAIPRGGIDVGLEVARGLGAELDVVLARKLRCPCQPELAFGAISEAGEVILDPHISRVAAISEDDVAKERQRQFAEIARRREFYRSVRPQAEIAGRSVIVTDDGIATGSTMVAALRSVRDAGARDVIVAVPVGSPDRVAEIARQCDRMICLLEPEGFQAVGQYDQSFDQVSDERVAEVLQAVLLDGGRHTAAGSRSV